MQNNRDTATSQDLEFRKGLKAKKHLNRTPVIISFGRSDCYGKWGLIGAEGWGAGEQCWTTSR